MPKKKPRDNLPKTVEPGDVTLPGHFGSRLIRGVTKAVREAVYDGHVQSGGMKKKKK